MKKGCPYGTHRVISPKGVLPQPADVIDNTMEIYDNEVLIDVQTLNVDSASFTEIVRRSCNGKKPADIENSPEDQAKVKQTMLDIVAKAGKHKNPWTGSGGMLLGTVKEIGPAYGILIRDASNFVGLNEQFFRIAAQTPEENNRDT